MNALELLGLAPQIIISVAIVFQMLLIAVKRSTVIIQLFTLGSLIIATLTLYITLPALDHQITRLFYLDGFSLGVNLIILSCAITVTVVSGRYLKVSQEVHDEYYLLLMLSTLGATLLTISNHFASVFLGLELLSIALVGLVGYLRQRRHTLEASFKYLILSATASSILLFGMAMLYAYSGEMSFNGLLPDTLDKARQSARILAQAGTVLVLIGIGFKLSLAPLHFWTPDVYQGAPAPVTMLLATVSKVAMFTVLIKFWFFAQHYLDQQLSLIIVGLAFTSMLVGNLLALQQTNIKRLLAFSSIAHMGYLLIVLMVTSQNSMQLAMQSALFYLMAYCLATLILFTFICETSKANTDSDADNWQHWQGLFWQSPLQATAIIFALLSLAGIPLTAGFIGKFYLLTAAVTNQNWWLLASLVIGSGIGLYYYLRIIFVMFMPIKGGETLPKRGVVGQSLLLGLTLALLTFGLLPQLYQFY